MYQAQMANEAYDRLPEACRAERALHDVSYHHHVLGHTPFYEYYQISISDPDHGADEFEPPKPGELKSEPSHSLWGLIYSIAQETGWTKDYIMNGVSYQNIQMMLADAPRLKKVKDEYQDSMANLISKMPPSDA